MKTYYSLFISLLITLCIGTSCSTYAQTRTFYHSQNLEAFAGVWEYAANGEVFRLVLKKGKINTSYAYGDYLIGGYSYSKNGVLLFDYTQNIPVEYISSEYVDDTPACRGTTYGAANPQFVDPNKVELYIKDFPYNKSGYAILSLLSPTTAHFKLGKSNWGKGYAGEREGFSIPTDVVMTKVQ